MDRGHSLAFLGSTLATGLVGPVTLSAAPSGHRPPAPWKKSVLRCSVGEVLEVLWMKCQKSEKF
jgi:hypothetical protein